MMIGLPPIRLLGVRTFGQGQLAQIERDTKQKDVQAKTLGSTTDLSLAAM